MSSTKRLTTDEFINRSKSLYGNKYNYDKVNYINRKTKVIITCPIHGDFYITPDNFLSGHTCSGCSKGNSLIEFIKKSKLIHEDKYDYSKVNYINGRTKVTITCPIHGEFEQTPINHIAGTGCPKCSVSLKRKDINDFIIESNKIHNNRYNYDKVIYKNNRTKVCITCPEHGDFWQIPSDHLRKIGCPKCKSSHMEEEVRNILSLNSIVFEEQKTWEWLVYKSNQYVDFFLPNYNIVIECQGIQHFEPVDFFGGKTGFKETVERDKHKLNLCIKNNIKVLYYSNLDDYKSSDIITNLKDLIDEIKRVA